MIFLLCLESLLYGLISYLCLTYGKVNILHIRYYSYLSFSLL